MHTHMYTNLYICVHVIPLVCTYVLISSLCVAMALDPYTTVTTALSLSLSLYLSRSRSRSRVHSLSLCLACPLSFSFLHTHTYAHAHKHARGRYDRQPSHLTESYAAESFSKISNPFCILSKQFDLEPLFRMILLKTHVVTIRPHAFSNFVV